LSSYAFPKMLFAIILPFIAITCADELSVSLGTNTSFCKSYEPEKLKYQKTNYLNPIEFSYIRQITPHFGMYAGLQYDKKTTYGEIQTSSIDDFKTIVSTGIVVFESSMNYVSIEVSPLIMKDFRKLSFDMRVGLRGDIYVYEKEKQFGELLTHRNNETSPFVLSIGGGLGIGYKVNDKIKVGIRSSFSRTITDVFRNQNENADIFFFNLYNVGYLSLLF
jgi:hypothetical protein